MANEQNLRTPSTKEAREMQRLSAKKRSQNIKEAKIIKEEILKRMNARDWDEIIYGVIDRAKKEKGDFETFQASIGQKPHEVVENRNIELKPILPKRDNGVRSDDSAGKD